jgi:hypothetical protein
MKAETCTSLKSPVKISAGSVARRDLMKRFNKSALESQMHKRSADADTTERQHIFPFEHTAHLPIRAHSVFSSDSY